MCLSCSYWSTRPASKRPTQTRRPFTIRCFHTGECFIIPRRARIIVRTRTTTMTTIVPWPTLITSTHDTLIRTSTRTRARLHPASMRPTNWSLLDPLNRRRRASTATGRNDGPRNADRVLDPPARSRDSEVEWPKATVVCLFELLFFFSWPLFFFGFQNQFCALVFVGFEEAIGYEKLFPLRHLFVTTKVIFRRDFIFGADEIKIQFSPTPKMLCTGKTNFFCAGTWKMSRIFPSWSR